MRVRPRELSLESGYGSRKQSPAATALAQSATGCVAVGQSVFVVSDTCIDDDGPKG